MSPDPPAGAVRTRFAPSPTGYLHIGGARTALYAWAHAKKAGGEFILRIEDTDAERSTGEARRAIVDSLDWLGLGHSGPFLQSEGAARHRELARGLVEAGEAYRCYMTPEELGKLREEMRARGEKPRYDRRWRDSGAAPPAGVDPVIRLKMPLEGSTVVDDLVKGAITIDNRELDDPVILRADGTPTYNFACAADDREMGITHVIRGEDHISNTPKQMRAIEALGGPVPSYAHLPLILARAVGEDGAPQDDAEGQPRYERMSKRNGAVDVLHYKREGFLPAGLLNYLACLGWAPGAEEIFGPDEFVSRFDLSEVNRAACRFDLQKLMWVNNRHMRLLGPARLGEMTDPPLPAGVAGMFHERAHTLRELEGDASYFVSRPEGASVGDMGEAARAAFQAFVPGLSALGEWTPESIKGLIKERVRQSGLRFKDIGMPLRLALTGRAETPDISEVAAILGKEETLARLEACGFQVTESAR